jgi:hypothetical protein
LTLISNKEAREIDQYVRGYGNEVIWSPHTSVVDTKAIMKYMVKEIEDLNPSFKIYKDTQYIKKVMTNELEDNIVETSRG